MNLGKKITSLFLAVLLVLGVVAQTVFAEETIISPLQYEIKQEVSEDNLTATISLMFGEMETVQVEKVILPDGTEQTDELSAISYNVTENGSYEFLVIYTINGAKQEEKLSVEITLFEGKKSDEAQVNTVKNEENTKGNQFSTLNSTGTTNQSEDVIFLDTENGNDINDGTSTEKSVKTLSKAKSLIKDNGTIKVNSQIRVTQDEVWDFTGLSNVKIERNTNNGTMVSVEGTSTLRLKNVTLDGTNSNGKTNNSVIEVGKIAGGKENGATLILDSGVVIENNKNYKGAGGAIAAFSYNKIIMNDGATIHGNEAQYGGAISLENHSTFEMNGGEIYDNIAVRGGAVSVIASDMVMNNGVIKNNSANSTDTYAGHYGGAICVSNYGEWSDAGDDSRNISGKANFTMNGGSITKNSATYSRGSDTGLGGAIATLPRFDKGYEKTPEVVIAIKNGEITENNAINGGAISAYFQATTLDLTGGKIEKNKATSKGGGIYAVYNSIANMANTQINNNTASSGGGVYLYASEFYMTSGNITGNTATNRGGGIYLDYPAYNGIRAQATLMNGDIKDNVAASNLGSDGIYQNSTLNIGESISIDKNNDVYLPYGKIINVIKPLTYINSINTVHITSEAKVVESNQTAGTKLIKYYTDAGGVDAAKKAELDQVYIRSKYMPADLVIGKSNYNSQEDFMTYIAKSKYTVNYEFISGIKDKDLPKEIVDLLPTDTKEYLQGTKVNAIQPDKTSVTVSDGVWTFKGYDANEKEATSNVKFTGTWEFKKNTYPVSYEFVSGTKDKELPDEVLALLPSDKNVYEHGTKVNAIQPDKTSVTVADGVWTFKGYDANEKEATSNVKFTGTWEFKKNTYPVSYEFVSGTKDKELPDEVLALLPSDKNVYEHGTKVNAIQPDKTSVTVADGVWTFKGYDANEKEATSNVKFTGTWEFKKNTSIYPANPNKPFDPSENSVNNIPSEKGIVNTGDSTNINLLAITFLSSGAILCSLLIGKKRKKKGEER